MASILLQSTVKTLDKTWQWLCDVLDVAEGQLREGKKFDTSVHTVCIVLLNTVYIHVIISGGNFH